MEVRENIVGMKRNENYGSLCQIIHVDFGQKRRKRECVIESNEKIHL